MERKARQYMEKEFTVKLNFTVCLFLVTYTLYTVYLLFMKINGAISVLIGGIIFYVFFFGFRPYKYVIDKKTLTIKYRLWKSLSKNFGMFLSSFPFFFFSKNQPLR